MNEDGKTVDARFTQARVARDLGLSLSTISRVRSQDRNPTLDLMMRLDRVYKWDVGVQARLHRDGQWLRGFESLLQSLAEVDG